MVLDVQLGLALAAKCLDLLGTEVTGENNILIAGVLEPTVTLQDVLGHKQTLPLIYGYKIFIRR